MTTAITIPASNNDIVFTVSDGQTVEVKVASVKNHPKEGVLVHVDGHMGIPPTSLISGKNAEQKQTRRSQLIAAPGTELTVQLMDAPSVKEIKGKLVGRITVNEQRAVQAAERANRANQDAERQAALEASVAALVLGSIIEGDVKDVASKESTREPGTQYVYGVFVSVGNGLSGLLHVRNIDGGDRGLKAIIAAGKAKFEIVSATVENGRPRIQLSQSSVALKEFYNQYPVGARVRGSKVIRTSEVADDLHGRIIELPSGARAFLADDDMNVKNESSLAKGNTTTVVITDQVVGGMVRVTRRGA